MLPPDDRRETAGGDARDRAVFDHARDAMFLADDDGRYVDVNPAACALLGYSRDELLALTIWDVTPPAALDEGRRLWKAFTVSGHLSGEYEMLRKDGARVPVEFNAVANVHPGIHLTINRDRSDRLRQQALLRASEQKYRHLLAHAPLVLFAVDAAGRFTLLEGRGLEPAGLSPGQDVGRCIFELYGDMEVVERSGRRTTSREVTSRALRGETIQGTTEVNGRIFENTVLPMRTASGAIDGMMGIAYDVTERKRAAEELHSSQSVLQSVVTSAPIIVFALDQQGVFTLSEGKGLEGLGLTPGQVVGMSAFDLYRDVPELTAYLRRALAGETFVGSTDVAGRWYETWYSPRLDANGTITGVLGVSTDLTDHRHLEEQLRQAQKLESVGLLAGGIAHDFNNMLTAITGYAEMILDQLPPGHGLRDEVFEISRAAEKASLLTYQLLAFSRKQILRPRMVSLNDVVTDVSRMLRRVIGEDLTLITRMSEGLWPVTADPGQLAQVILNLAVNARDAMSNGGTLTIETANVALDDDYARAHEGVQPGPYVLLAVSDTGAGMTPDVRARIFEPFFTTKGVGRGTGMGLATVYGIVKQSGGHVWVYSEVGRGSTFKVYLPRTVDAGRSREAPVEDAGLARGKETLLLVEDEEVVRRLARRALESCGYTVLEAADGAQALALFQNSPAPVQMLVTDVIMPGMSGRALAERLWEASPRLSVLYMSGYTDSAIVHRGVLDEGTHFIQKPFTMRSLAQKVREVLDGPAPRPPRP